MIKSIRIKHFKAIKDSGKLKLGPLTVFVGHNGTGKSSIIEALEFFSQYAVHGLGTAIDPWYDARHVWWQGSERTRQKLKPFLSNPLEIQMGGQGPKGSAIRTWSAEVKFSELTENIGRTTSGTFVPQTEVFRAGGRFLRRRNFGEIATQSDARNAPKLRELAASESLFIADPHPDWDKWLFLNLDPYRISEPRQRVHLAGASLERSGGNLARYLQSFLEIDPDGFAAMVEALAYILPYASDVSPITSRDLISQSSFLQLTERFNGTDAVELPAWVLSGGTLRILTLIAALRHPEPPPVLFVEEIENGLDPRALGFIVEEIRYATESGHTQVIATTHSPYLLDKLSLEHVIMVDRERGEPPTFSKASDSPELKAWSERFAPGNLYTMGMFTKKGGHQ
jgi:predicted ATPase